MALALYRKYRPRTFAEVIGQEHVTEPLSQALRSGRLHHAYLFSGPRGCGKTSSARILARSLNCEQGPTPEPCGVCASCRSLANDGAGSIDVIEIDAASHGGVDDARELREKAFFAPASSRYKIYVIDEAHMVSSAGFNALLKLVEEPPEYVKFIFATTEPEKVLGTIRSRTHHYPFRLIPPAVLRPYLQQLTEAEGIHVEPAVFPLVVRAGGGSARDTLSVLDQLIAGAGPDGVSYSRAVALLGVTDVTLIDEMCDALAAGDGAAAYRTIDRVAEAGHDPRRFASDLLERFRDLIVLQQVPDATSKGLIDGPADQLETMTAQAGRLGPATLSRCADITHNGLVEMRGTTAPRLLLELITARMLLPGAEDSTGALLQRLERMERRLAQGGELPAARGETAPPAPTAAAAPIPAAPMPSAPAPSVAPVSAVPSSEAAPAGRGGGLSAARAAAAAASRKSATTAANRRPGAQPPAAAPTSAPPAAAPTSEPPAAAPTSAPPAAASNPAPPAAASPASEAVPELAEAVSALPPTAPPPGTAEALSGPVGSEPETAAAQRLASEGVASEPEYYDDEPPWDDDEPEYEPASDPGRTAAAADPAEVADSRAGRSVAAADLAEVAAGPTERSAEASADGSGDRSSGSGEAAVDGSGDRSGGSVGGAPGRSGEPAGADSPPAHRDGATAPARAGAETRDSRGRSGEPAGLLPDAPEEPGAAAVADVPGQLTVDGVREAWPEVIAAIKQQPNGKIAGPMAASAVVRALEGDTLVLVFQHPNLVERISRFTSLITDALYETFGSRWQIRCEVGSGGNVPAARVAARRDTPPSGGGRARNDAPRAQVSAPPRTSPGAQQSQAAAARPPQARRQETESPSGGDDDWPEPVKPGGLAAPTAPAPIEDDEEDWPEVRAIGGPASEPPSPAGGTEPLDSAVTAPASAERASPAAPVRPDDTTAAGAIAEPAGLDAAAPLAEPAPAAPISAAPAMAASRPSAPIPSAPSVGAPNPTTPSSGAPGPTAPSSGAPSPGATTSGVPRVGAGGPTAPSSGAPSPGGASADGARSGASSATAASSPGAAAAARAARNAAGGGGLAAARAAAAAAAAGRQNGGRAATAAANSAAEAPSGGNSGRAWADGSPTEEAPYDPEFDGPVKGGGGFEGFDPGDEPLDEVLDEKTARESGEQQAMRLLQEMLGAEKIGES